MLKFSPRLLRVCPNLLPPASLRCVSDDTDSEKRESQVIARLREEMLRDKEALKWRKTNDEMGHITTKLKYMNNEEQTSDFLVMMQKPFELDPRKLFESWHKKQEKKERFMQQFVKERHEILGPDLATAHFILHRGGSVKFFKDKQWMKADEKMQFNLPTTYVSTFKLEAIKCDNMKLYYEGLENIRWLHSLKFLSFHNVKTFDDWCLDRVSGSQCENLEVLDISGTKCTFNGLSCLYRLNNLKLLIVTDPKESLEYELCSAMLQEVLPNLKIAKADTIH